MKVFLCFWINKFDLFIEKSKEKYQYMVSFTGWATLHVTFLLILICYWYYYILYIIQLVNLTLSVPHLASNILAITKTNWTHLMFLFLPSNSLLLSSSSPAITLKRRWHALPLITRDQFSELLWPGCSHLARGVQTFEINAPGVRNPV